MLLCTTLVLILGLEVLAQDFESNITGLGISAVFPGQAGFAAASTPFNLRFDFRPTVIAYPSTTEQVSELVALGASTNMHVVARSGGHSYIANGLGGASNALVIDLRNITSITFDSSETYATIGMGNRLGDVAQVLNDVAGRALPHGSCSYVGIGGHASAGGFGFPSRMWGLTLDTIVSMQVVLANASVVTASESENADLFWAMRGAGSSFGITTYITTQTFSAPSYAIIFDYSWHLNYTEAADALGAFQDYVQTDIPAELGAELNLLAGDTEGTLSFSLGGGWYGAQDQLNATLQPFLDAMPAPLSWSLGGDGTWIGSVANLAGGSTNTSAPDGNGTFYAKSLMVPSPLTQPARLSFMKALVTEGFETNTSWFMQVELYGGSNSAINRVSLDDTAFAYRDTLFTIQLYTSAPGSIPPFPEEGFVFLDDIAHAIVTAMPSDWAYGAYLNYADNKLANYTSLYYASHYPRLQALKKELDPNGVFWAPTDV